MFIRVAYGCGFSFFFKYLLEIASYFVIIKRKKGV